MARFSILNGGFSQFQGSYKRTREQLIKNNISELFRVLNASMSSPERSGAVRPILQIWSGQASGGFALLQHPLHADQPLDGVWSDNDGINTITIHLTQQLALVAEHQPGSFADNWSLSIAIDGADPIPLRRHPTAALWRGSGGMLLGDRATLQGAPPRLTVHSARLETVAEGWSLAIRELRLDYPGLDASTALPIGTSLKATLSCRQQLTALSGAPPAVGSQDTHRWNVSLDQVSADDDAAVTLQSDLFIDSGTPLSLTDIPIHIAVQFQEAKVFHDGRLREDLPDGEALECLWLRGAASQSAPRYLDVLLSNRADEEDEQAWSQMVRLERGPAQDGGQRYRLPQPLKIPQSLRPGWLYVHPLGQDKDAGAVSLTLSWIRCCWRLVVDNDCMVTPRLVQTHLQPVGSSWPKKTEWSPASDHRALVSKQVYLPIKDDEMTPLLLSPRGPGEPILGAEPGWTVTLGVPGKEIQSVRLRSSGALLHGPDDKNADNIAPLTRPESLIQQVIRITTNKRHFGIVYPSRNLGGIPPRWRKGTELSIIDGHFLLPQDSDCTWLLWLRGLCLPCILRPLDKEHQWMLALEEPLPCDGRLGLDVGPFLPLRGVVYTRDGVQRIRLRSDGRDVDFEHDSDWGWLGEGLWHAWPDGVFAPRSSETPAQRHAWSNLVWQERDGQIDFLGWLISPTDGFTSPGTDTFSAWGLRLVPSLQLGTMEITSLQDPQINSLAQNVQDAVRKIFTRNLSNATSVETPSGRVLLRPVFASRLSSTVSHIQVRFSAAQNILPDVRMFAPETQ